jgi:hypothetical protein
LGKQEKAVARLLTIPADFSWQELSGLLRMLGYNEVQGAGSRVKFDNGNPDQLISLHRPHPGNIVRRYALRQVIDTLSQAGLL